MIIELICAPLLLLVRGIISLIPILTYIPTSIVDTISMLIKAMQFFPFDVWFITTSSFVFWISAHLVYSFFNFIIRLIPLINIGK